MREIKFRVWDQGNSEWRYYTLYGLIEGGDGVVYHIDHSKSGQWTGLHDKNGKEIYEGDVLRLHCGSADGTFEMAEVNAKVTWHKDRFAVKLPDKTVVAKQGSLKGKEVHVRDMHSWVGMHTCLLEGESKLEVIGNIYENPELL
jgi:uncharacterized phage protein (TIGR01671 family)